MSEEPKEDLDRIDEPDVSEEEFEQLGARASPDILHGVQSKLHERSGGRFYRDRYSRMHSTSITIWITAAIIIGACALWLLLS